MSSAHALQLLIGFLTSGVSVFLVAKVMPGFRAKSLLDALLFAFVVAVLDTIAWHVLGLLTWGFTFLTMGVGFFIVNGVIFLLGKKIVRGIEISGCFVAAIASVLVALVNAGIHALIS